MTGKLTVTAAWVACTGLVVALLSAPPPTPAHMALAVVMVFGSVVGLYGVTLTWSGR